MMSFQLAALYVSRISHRNLIHFNCSNSHNKHCLVFPSNKQLPISIHRDIQSNLLWNVIHVNLKSRMCPTKIFPGQILSCYIRALFQLCTITQILFIFTQNKSQDVADEAAYSQSLLHLTKVIFNILSESY